MRCDSEGMQRRESPVKAFLEFAGRRLLNFSSKKDNRGSYVVVPNANLAFYLNFVRERFKLHLLT
jgi:hypothetical protein